MILNLHLLLGYDLYKLVHCTVVKDGGRREGFLQRPRLSIASSTDIDSHLDIA